MIFNKCNHEWEILKKSESQDKFTIIQRCKKCGKLERCTA